MTHTAVRELRNAYDEFQPNQNIVELLDYVRELVSPDGGSVNGSEERQATLTKEDLHLVVLIMCGARPSCPWKLLCAGPPRNRGGLQPYIVAEGSEFTVHGT